MMDFSNGRLAEPFRQQISKLKPGLFRDKAVHIAQLVADGQSPPTGVIPRWAGLLLLTVDTQKDSFWYVLRALGHACRSKLIRYGEVRTFDELVALADARFPIEGLDNTYLHAARAFIDSGGTQDMDADSSRTDQVYRIRIELGSCKFLGQMRLGSGAVFEFELGAGIFIERLVLSFPMAVGDSKMRQTSSFVFIPWKGGQSGCDTVVSVVFVSTDVVSVAEHAYGPCHPVVQHLIVQHDAGVPCRSEHVR